MTSSAREHLREDAPNTDLEAVDPDGGGSGGEGDDAPDGDVEQRSLLHDGEGFGGAGRGELGDGGPYSYSRDFDPGRERQTPRSFLLLCIVLPAMIGLGLYAQHYHPSMFSSSWWQDLGFGSWFGGGAGGKSRLPLFVLNDTVAPTVLISIDGFRHDYVDRKDASTGEYLAPVLRDLAANGVRAMPGMEPVMPTKTFPNHWSLVTGLYAESHGVIGNTMYDATRGKWFHTSTTDAEWWGGEPIWVTLRRTPRTIDMELEGDNVTRAEHLPQLNYSAASVFWVGSDVDDPALRPDVFWHYDKHVSYARRVDRVVDLLCGTAKEYRDLKRKTKLQPYDDDKVDRDAPLAAQLVTLYFERVDAMGHAYGPESDEVSNAIRDADAAIGRLRDALRDRLPGVPVNYVVVSDHGFASTPPNQTIDLSSVLSPGSVQDVVTTPLGYWINVSTDAATMASSMDKAFNTMVDGDEPAMAFLSNGTPEDWHLRNARHITPIVSLAEVGWTVTYPHQSLVRDATNTDEKESNSEKNHKEKFIMRGNHGFHYRRPEMQATFIASGPAFQSGVQASGFRVVDVYPLLCEMFGAVPAPHNGSLDVSKASILRK